MVSNLIKKEDVKLMLSELLDLAEKENFSAYDVINHAVDWVENISTAYDIDKVVEELEELRERIINDDYDVCATFSGCMKIDCDRCEQVILTNKAIEIVKSGGNNA